MPCFNLDLDDLLAYKTVKTISVRHRWLGGIYYGMMLAILGWTTYSVLAPPGQYKKTIAVYGAVRASVREPQPPAGFPPLGAMHYCAPPSSPPTGEFSPTLPCTYPDMASGELSRVTPGDDGALLVGTRLSTTHQVRNPACNAGHAAQRDYTCPPWNDAAAGKESVYVAGLEACTLVFAHSVSKTVQRMYTCSTIFGASIHCNDNSEYVLDTFTANRPPAIIYGPPVWDPTAERFLPARQKFVTPMPYGDQLNMSDLLEVAGLDLDLLHADNVHLDKKTGQPTNTTERYDGQTLRVRVKYTGYRLSSPPTATYAYYVATNDLEAKLVYNSHGANASERVLSDLHGLQLLFSQEADLTRFDFWTLALALISGAALLSLAKVAADSFLLYFSPRRADYRLFVASSSPDFSPDNEEEREVLHRILKRKRQKAEDVLRRQGTVGLAQPLQPRLGDVRGGTIEPLECAGEVAAPPPPEPPPQHQS